MKRLAFALLLLPSVAAAEPPPESLPPALAASPTPNPGETGRVVPAPVLHDVHTVQQSGSEAKHDAASSALPLVPVVRDGKVETAALCVDVPILSPGWRRALTITGTVLGIVSGVAVSSVTTYAQGRQAGLW